MSDYGYATDEVESDVMCDWYALCNNWADGLVDHPVLGPVATCERCAEMHGLVFAERI